MMIWSIPTKWQFPELFMMLLPMTSLDFQSPGRMLLSTLPGFRPTGMMGKACLPSNAL